MSESQIDLDEVAAPEPVYDQTEKPLQRHSYLESHRSPKEQDAQWKSDEGRTESLKSPEEQESGPPAVEKEPTRGHSHHLQQLFVISHLVFFSFSGALLRIAIECLTFYPGSPVNTSVLWANVGGSLIMGFLSEDQNLFFIKETEQRSLGDGGNNIERRQATLKKHKKTVPLYIGLTTGFCGSFTSFSTFIRDIFLALVNSVPVPLGPYWDISLFTEPSAEAKAPSGGFSFMAILAVLFTEIGLSLAGLFLGAHLATGLSQWTPRLPQRRIQTVLDPLVVVLAAFSWIAVICLVVVLPQYSRESTIWSSELWRGPVLFSLVFAPVGCLARYFISLNFNAKIPSFPLGTFLANVAGTMVLGMAYSLQHAEIGPSSLAGGSFIGCQVLQGIMDGFCGCLTTVSTWVLELSDLRRRHAYFYGITSVVIAFCALVIEMGSLEWTMGFKTPTCFIR